MAAKNIYFERNKGLIHLWDDELGYKVFPYERYAYQIDPKGDHITMNGLKVKKVKEWNDNAAKDGLVFEHDVPVLTRVLIDKYFENDDPSKDCKILYFDIEVEKGEKYSTVQEANNTITSIAYWNNFEQVYHCLLLDEDFRLEDQIIDEINLRRFDSEAEMLIYFMNQWKKMSPDIISGWNLDYFDVPYLYNRCKQIIGVTNANKMSPIGIVEENKYGRNFSLKIAGVSQMDGLMLYKQYTYSEQPRYTLEAISQFELKRGKVKYEGSLDDLYKNDIKSFVKYNVEDIVLPILLEKKLGFLETARGICHKGHVPYEDITMSSRIMDGASLTYCKRNGLVASRGVQSEDKSQAEGAFVKIPEPGLYKFIFDCDATSLYPSNIRTLNISPETLFGKVNNWSESGWISKNIEEFDIQVFVNNISDSLFGENELKFKVQFDKFQDFLDEYNLSIASNGCLYKMDKPGLIPSILTSWFNERKEFSRKAAECKNAGDLVGYEYYDKKQLITKILLNSFYGVLLLPTFRFYNKDNGEAVTFSGKSVLQYAMKVANSYYNKKLGTDKTDYVIGGDTDSIFLPTLPLVRLNYDGDEDSILVKEALSVVDEVQTTINSSFDVYAKKLHNVKTHFWEFKQEMVARRAFFGMAKKRYAMWIINKKRLNVDELELKGLDVVRSSFPQAFRKFMKQLIVDILHDVPVNELNKQIADFRVIFRKEKMNDIMLPTGVKELSKFKPGQKATPIHVKSSQNYNKLLDLFKINNVPKISDGDKIIWSYLKKNPYGFDSIALRGYDDPQELIEFVEKFIDKEKIFNNTLMSKIETIWEDLGWGKVIFETDNEFF